MPTTSADPAWFHAPLSGHERRHVTDRMLAHLESEVEADTLSAVERMRLVRLVETMPDSSLDLLVLDFAHPGRPLSQRITDLVGSARSG